MSYQYFVIVDSMLIDVIIEWSNLPIEYDSKWMTVTLRLPEEVSKGDIMLSLKFTGILNDKMHGFYRSSYKAADGAQRYLASTQFEVCLCAINTHYMRSLSTLGYGSFIMFC